MWTPNSRNPSDESPRTMWTLQYFDSDMWTHFGEYRTLGDALRAERSAIAAMDYPDATRWCVSKALNESP